MGWERRTKSLPRRITRLPSNDWLAVRARMESREACALVCLTSHGFH